MEHCRDPKTQNKVMDEVLGSVSMLAQDQYGNYVVQVCNLVFKDSLYVHYASVSVKVRAVRC